MGGDKVMTGTRNWREQEREIAGVVCGVKGGFGEV